MEISLWTSTMKEKKIVSDTLNWIKYLQTWNMNVWNTPWIINPRTKVRNGPTQTSGKWNESWLDSEKKKTLLLLFLEITDRITRYQRKNTFEWKYSKHHWRKAGEQWWEC